MLCGWEGNRMSGVAVAMHHRLSGLSTYGLNGQRMGDEHHAYTPNGARPDLPFAYTSLQKRVCNFV